jgi:hypothetical protein
MPCRYVIDPERCLVVSTGWDRVTFAEMKAHQDQLAKDLGFNPAFDQSVDATAVTSVNISTDEAKTIAGRRFFSPTSRRAFVASNVLGVGHSTVNRGVCAVGERPRTGPRVSWPRFCLELS